MSHRLRKGPARPTASSIKTAWCCACQSRWYVFGRGMWMEAWSAHTWELTGITAGIKAPTFRIPWEYKLLTVAAICLAVPKPAGSAAGRAG